MAVYITEYNMNYLLMSRKSLDFFLEFQYYLGCYMEWLYIWKNNNYILADVYDQAIWIAGQV